jgi:hypothetical protein
VVPVTIPSEWYGKQVEIIAFPVENISDKNPKDDIMKYFGAWESDESMEESVIYSIR